MEFGVKSFLSREQAAFRDKTDKASMNFLCLLDNSDKTTEKLLWEKKKTIWKNAINNMVDLWFLLKLKSTLSVKKWNKLYTQILRFRLQILCINLDHRLTVNNNRLTANI